LLADKIFVFLKYGLRPLSLVFGYGILDASA
jgi:hypothetical protein